MKRKIKIERQDTKMLTTITDVQKRAFGSVTELYRIGDTDTARCGNVARGLAIAKTATADSSIKDLKVYNPESVNGVTMIVLNVMHTLGGTKNVQAMHDGYRDFALAILGNQFDNADWDPGDFGLLMEAEYNILAALQYTVFAYKMYGLSSQYLKLSGDTLLRVLGFSTSGMDQQSAIEEKLSKIVNKLNSLIIPEGYTGFEQFTNLIRTIYVSEENEKSILYLFRPQVFYLSGSAMTDGFIMPTEWTDNVNILTWLDNLYDIVDQFTNDGGYREMAKYLEQCYVQRYNTATPVGKRMVIDLDFLGYHMNDESDYILHFDLAMMDFIRNIDLAPVVIDGDLNYDSERHLVYDARIFVDDDGRLEQGFVLGQESTVPKESEFYGLHLSSYYQPTTGANSLQLSDTVIANPYGGFIPLAWAHNSSDSSGFICTPVKDSADVIFNFREYPATEDMIVNGMYGKYSSRLKFQTFNSGGIAKFKNNIACNVVTADCGLLFTSVTIYGGWRTGMSDNPIREPKYVIGFSNNDLPIAEYLDEDGRSLSIFKSNTFINPLKGEGGGYTELPILALLNSLEFFPRVTCLALGDNSMRVQVTSTGVAECDDIDSHTATVITDVDSLGTMSRSSFESFTYQTVYMAGLCLLNEKGLLGQPSGNSGGGSNNQGHNKRNHRRRYKGKGKGKGSKPNPKGNDDKDKNDGKDK